MSAELADPTKNVLVGTSRASADQPSEFHVLRRSHVDANKAGDTAIDPLTAVRRGPAVTRNAVYGKPVFELQAHSPHRMSRRPRGISTRPSRADCRLSWKGSMMPDAVLFKTCRLCKLSSGRLNKRKTTGGTWLGETRMYQDSAGGVRRPTPGKGGRLLGQACGLVESLENRGLVLKSASKLGAWEGPRVSLGGLVAESLDPTSVVSSILVANTVGLSTARTSRPRRVEGERPQKPQK